MREGLTDFGEVFSHPDVLSALPLCAGDLCNAAATCRAANGAAVWRAAYARRWGGASLAVGKLSFAVRHAAEEELRGPRADKEAKAKSRALGKLAHEETVRLRFDCGLADEPMCGPDFCRDPNPDLEPILKVRAGSTRRQRDAAVAAAEEWASEGGAAGEAVAAAFRSSLDCLDARVTEFIQYSGGNALSREEMVWVSLTAPDGHVWLLQLESTGAYQERCSCVSWKLEAFDVGVPDAALAPPEAAGPWSRGALLSRLSARRNPMQIPSVTPSGEDNDYPNCILVQHPVKPAVLVSTQYGSEARQKASPPPPDGVISALGKAVGLGDGVKHSADDVLAALVLATGDCTFSEWTTPPSTKKKRSPQEQFVTDEKLWRVSTTLDKAYQVTAQEALRFSWETPLRLKEDGDYDEEGFVGGKRFEG